MVYFPFWTWCLCGRNSSSADLLASFSLTAIVNLYPPLKLTYTDENGEEAGPRKGVILVCRSPIVSFKTAAVRETSRGGAVF